MDRELDLRRCASIQAFHAAVHFGMVAFILQLPFSIPKDIRRIKDFAMDAASKVPFL